MFMQNPSCHLLQSQLTELIDSHSRSSELIQVLNKFGVVVSRDTMSRCIVATVKNLTGDKIKSQANKNHQSFKLQQLIMLIKMLSQGKSFLERRWKTCMPLQFSQ